MFELGEAGGSKQNYEAGDQRRSGRLWAVWGNERTGTVDSTKIKQELLTPRDSPNRFIEFAKA